VRVQDNLALDQSHTFASCTNGFGGRVKCSDTVGGRFKADFKPLHATPSVFTVKVNFLHLGINAPFAAPVKVTITHNGAVVRMDTISDCRESGSGLSCREF